MKEKKSKKTKEKEIKKVCMAAKEQTNTQFSVESKQQNGKVKRINI